MTHFDITIISDTVCPFCHLGKMRLDRAISLYRKTVPGGSSSTFTIRWHAYLLDRNPPAKSMSVLDAAAGRFGAHRLPAKQARMAQLGAQEGLDYTFAGRIGASRDSHRMVQLGVTKGLDVADRLMGAIMGMFFEEGADITSWDDLETAAARVGIDRDEARRWLEDGEGGEQVDREVAEAYRMGLNGVPKFIINGAYEVDGAEDVSGFLAQLVAAKDAAEDGVAAKERRIRAVCGAESGCVF
ncbi:DSBA-like thioredoxin domain-containing protein [Hirsutella rhossiliensis]|uniref:DSBA-like thioredoxin domain-containing protein n=1 Tax=Hirsutella rhossiliensis TaxID=111463 RepID=A0A9P8N0M7_9HYPO|nr:DSBA-like thioredoxin domain-containing protein [Hirsutella rhossiliensis]KAH0964659.1 DSBA-like thioredoxin domain-containing protein [Hirsutella rhossiliensis]